MKFTATASAEFTKSVPDATCMQHTTPCTHQTLYVAVWEECKP